MSYTATTKLETVTFNLRMFFHLSTSKQLIHRVENEKVTMEGISFLKINLDSIRLKTRKVLSRKIVLVVPISKTVYSEKKCFLNSLADVLQNRRLLVH